MDHLSYEVLEQLLAEGGRQVEPGSRWRHYKGTEYTVVSIVIIEATNEPAVVYASAKHPDVSFVRPLQVWLEEVEVDGQKVPRFSRV